MLPVGEGADKAIDAFLDGRFADAPRDSSAPLKARLRNALRVLAKDAERVGGIDMIMPIGTPWNAPMSAGIVLSVAGTRAPAGESAAELLDALAVGSPGSIKVETNAGSAVREQIEISRGDVEADAIVPMRTVHHNWPIPAQPGRFLIGSLTVSGSGDPELEPLIDALTGLYDAMMGSLEWTAEATKQGQSA